MKVERRYEHSGIVDLTLEPQEFDRLERALLDTKLSPFHLIYSKQVFYLNEHANMIFQDRNKNWIWLTRCDPNNNQENKVSGDVAAEPFIWDCVLEKSTG